MKRIHVILLMTVLLFTGCQSNQQLNFSVNGVSFKMIRVDGGILTTEAIPEHGTGETEKPAHEVILSDYYIGETEVTQELWEAVMGSNPSKQKGNSKCPVEMVSWNDVVDDFLPKLNELTGKTFTLPTEAQWEFAARGGNKSKGYKYSGSNNVNEVAWYGEDYQTGTTHPVGQKLPNELGLYDMSGNVHESCSDWYESDPTRPTRIFRASRGGSCRNEASFCRVSNRRFNLPARANEKSGFRLALSNNIVLNKNSITLVKGQSEILTAGPNGIIALDNGLTWSSSNPSAATVDSNGKVTAFGAGSALITVKVNDIGKEDTCNVDVLDGICIVANGVQIPMIKVDGGTFIMGSTPKHGTDATDYEKPAHQVLLSDYYIGQTEVTQGLWEAVMGSNSSHNESLENPVRSVSWNDIVNDFLPKLNALTGKNFTLPTEAQWEYAARGGNKSKGYKYSGSNNIDDVAWYEVENFVSMVHPVAHKFPNELGIYDMSGNVWEWCTDRYGPYSAEAQTDPTGQATGLNRVLRGGSFFDNVSTCTVSYRNWFDPYDFYLTIGFRLALSL